MDQHPAATPMPAVPSRPLGITIMAIVAGIVGVFGLVAGLALFGLSGILDMVGGASVAGAGTTSSLVALVSGAIALAFAYGAWKLKPWAWPLGLAFAAFAVVSGVLGLTSGSDLTSVAIGIVIAGAVAFYLMTPAVKAAFGRS